MRVLLALALLLCLLAYAGSFSGGFLFDDFNNILNNGALRAILDSGHDWLAVAMSSGSGLLRRPISMLSFGLDVSLFGMDPKAMRMVNLGLHLANGVLVFLLARRLVQRLLRSRTINPENVAVFVTACWLLHPLLVSNVAYIVQRMNLLATLFTLAGLLCYAIGRGRDAGGDKGLPLALAGLCGFGVLATLSKENGVLIVAYAWIIELTCFRFHAATPTRQWILKAFFWLTLALPIVVFAAWLALHPEWLPARFANRDFTVVQRVLTESRILFHYLLWIFVPNPAWMGLHHDDIVMSTGLLAPASTLLAMVLLIAMAATAWCVRTRMPALSLAIGWFLIGHSMESTFLSLELVFEHRNYLPLVGLLLGGTCTLAPWLGARLPSVALASVAAALVLTLAALTASRASTWGDPYALAMTEVLNHPRSSRAQFLAGRSIIIRGIQSGDRTGAETQALPYLQRSAELDQNQIAPLTEILLIQSQRGPVPAGTIDDLANRLRKVPHYTKANSFLDLLVTLSTQPGSVSREDVAKLVAAAETNPRFPRKFRAMILNNYGAYHFNVLKDQPAAVRLTLQAASLQPKNPYFEINLAQIALAMGNPQLAARHLLNARKLDVTGAHAVTILSLQRNLGLVLPDAR